MNDPRRHPIEDLLQQAGSYVVASASLRSRTIDAARRRSQRRMRATILASATGLIIMVGGFSIWSSYGSVSPWAAAIVPAAPAPPDLQGQALERVGDQGSQLTWALCDGLFNQRSRARR